MNEASFGTTMCVQQIGDLMLVVHAAAPPDAEEWSRYCDQACTAKAKTGGALKTLVISEHDAGPNAGQRVEYKKKVAGTSNRIAVVTSGSVTRAILTAMSWFNPNMKAFELDQLQPALDYLGVRLGPELRAAIHDLKTYLRLAS
jgi:hypothetical protein